MELRNTAVWYIPKYATYKGETTMKKVFALLLLATFAVSLLSGCEALGYYKVEVTGATGSLTEPLKPYYKAGTKIELRSSIATDVTLHVFVNGEEIPLSYNGNGYWAFQFVMPENDITVHMTYDEFYGKDEFYLSELEQAPKFLEDGLFRVSVKKTNAKEEYVLVENRYSSKAKDIEAFKNLLYEPLQKIDNDNSNVEFYYGYSFFHNVPGSTTDVRSIEFDDSVYYWRDFSRYQAFGFKNTDYSLPVIDDPELITYSFKNNGAVSVKKYGDDSFVKQFTDMDSVEFIPYTGEPIEATAEFYIDSGYGKINLLTPTYFELNGICYEIVYDNGYWVYDTLNLGA